MPRMRRGHAVGVEFLELVELFADADELDGLAGDGLDAQGSAAAGVAVELGQNDAVELQPLVELLGGVDGVLAGHRVADQVDLVRRDRLGDLGHLRHHLLIDVQPAGGIDHDHILAVLLGIADAVFGDLDGVFGGLIGIDRNPGLFAEDFQLLDSGRSLQVVGDHQGMSAVRHEVLAQLGGGRRLAATLEAGQHDDRRAGRDEVDPRIHRPHEPGQLVVDDLDHHLARMEALDDLGPDRLIPHVLAELLDDVVVDVGFQQRLADVVHGVGDVGLGDPPPPGQRPKHRIEFFRQRLEHRNPLCLFNENRVNPPQLYDGAPTGVLL